MKLGGLLSAGVGSALGGFRNTVHSYPSRHVFPLLESTRWLATWAGASWGDLERPGRRSAGGGLESAIAQRSGHSKEVRR